MRKKLSISKNPIADFLIPYQKSTSYAYRSGILNYFDFVAGKRMRGREATADDFAAYETFAADYLQDKKRNYSADIVSYVKNLGETGTAPKTARVRVVAVKEFLNRYEIDLDPRTLKDVKRLQPKGGKRTNFEHVDPKILCEILHHVDARGKAFILVLASSGMRLGEALNINWSDVKTPDRTKFTDKPTSIFIRTSKTGQSRTVFITRECEQALSEWRKIYASYRDYATKISGNLKKDDLLKRNGDDRVFPFTRTSVYKIWDRALRNTQHFNLDAETNRQQMNLHRLRSFFSVQVAGAAGQQVSELLLGHTDAYGGAYTGRSPEQLEREYMKAEHLLTIGATSSAIEATSREVAELKRQLDEVKADMSNYKEKVLSEVIGDSVFKGADGKVHFRPINENLLKKLDLEVPADPVLTDDDVREIEREMNITTEE